MECRFEKRRKGRGSAAALWAAVLGIGGLALYIVFWLELDNDQGYDQPDLVLQPLRAKTSEINAARRCN